MGPGVGNIRMSAPRESLLSGHVNIPFTIDGYGTSYGSRANALSLAANDLTSFWGGALSTCAPRQLLRCPHPASLRRRRRRRPSARRWRRQTAKP